jgi:hypothetical protein
MLREFPAFNLDATSSFQIFVMKLQMSGLSSSLGNVEMMTSPGGFLNAIAPVS